MSKDDDIFLKQMVGVKPIKKNNKIQNKKNTKKPKETKSPTIKKTKNTPKNNHKPRENKKKLEFRLEKINIKKNIKKQLYIIDKKIDFHGKTLSESEQLFSKSIIQCYDRGLRCLLFVTGKGLHKQKDSYENQKPRLYYGVIRRAFLVWVNSNEFSKHILAYETARTEHGGDGAFYVYLRKKN